MSVSFGRVALAVLVLGAGVMHFLFPASYERIVPPYLPAPHLLVLISGACEVLGGAGLLVPSSRRLAAWGLVALLVAVLPANVQMAFDHARWPRIPEWALWARLPIQLPLIWWAWRYTQDRG